MSTTQVRVLEILDNKIGAISGKTLKWRHEDLLSSSAGQRVETASTSNQHHLDSSNEEAVHAYDLRTPVEPASS